MGTLFGEDLSRCVTSLVLPTANVFSRNTAAATCPTATNTTELIDLSVPSPQWVSGPPMVKGRVQLNATILPNGKVLVSGGSVKDEVSATAVKDAQIYDPVSNKLSSASSMQFPTAMSAPAPEATVMPTVSRWGARM